MKSDTPQTPGSKSSDPINVGSFAGAGLQFAISIVLFLFIGQWIDKKLETSPAFLIAGVFLGGAAAFYSMYRKLAAAQKADDERRKREKQRT
ncbi:MAG: AtpZ/AtpI family protein [Gemmatimonadales bacterium]